MLGRQHERPEPRGAGGAGPLAAVERGGIEQAGVLVAVAPFTVGEGVDAEVEEQRQFLALPAQLRRRGNRAGGVV